MKMIQFSIYETTNLLDKSSFLMMVTVNFIGFMKTICRYCKVVKGIHKISALGQMLMCVCTVSNYYCQLLLLLISEKGFKLYLTSVFMKKKKKKLIRYG